MGKVYGWCNLPKCAIPIVCLALIGISIIGCVAPKEVSTITEREQYRFEFKSKTLPADLLKAMSPVSGVLPAMLLTPDAPIVEWDQQQFLDLVSALMLKKNIQGGKIKSLDFGLPCRGAQVGPQSFEIVFYHIEPKGNAESVRIETRIHVDAQSGFIELTTTEIFPSDSGIFDAGDLSAKIPAEKAITLVEQVGGKSERSAREDKCIILGSLLENEWFIRYRPTDKGSTDFTMSMNAITGEVCSTARCR